MTKKSIDLVQETYTRLEDQIPTLNLSKQKSRKLATKGLMKTVENKKDINSNKHVRKRIYILNIESFFYLVCLIYHLEQIQL